MATNLRGIFLVTGIGVVLVAVLLLALGQSSATAQTPCQETVLPAPASGVVTATVAFSNTCFQFRGPREQVTVGVVLNKPAPENLMVEVYIDNPTTGGLLVGAVPVAAGQMAGSRELPLLAGQELYIGLIYSTRVWEPGETPVSPAVEMGEPHVAQVVDAAPPPTVAPPTLVPPTPPPTPVPPTPVPPVCEPGQPYPGPDESPCRKPRPGEPGYELPAGVKGPRAFLPAVSR